MTSVESLSHPYSAIFSYIVKRVSFEEQVVPQPGSLLDEESHVCSSAGTAAKGPILAREMNACEPCVLIWSFVSLCSQEVGRCIFSLATKQLQVPARCRHKRSEPSTSLKVASISDSFFYDTLRCVTSFELQL